MNTCNMIHLIEMCVRVCPPAR